MTYMPPDKRWSVSAFVENLGDVAIKQYTLGNPGFLVGQRYAIVSSDSRAGYPVPRFAAT